MKALEQPSRSLVPAIGLLVLLVVLALLQFRWTGQLSRAEGVRLRANLSRNVAGFSREFNREITRALATFAFGSSDSAEALADRFDDWTERATYPEIVSDVLLVNLHTDQAPEILRFDPIEQRLHGFELTPNLEPAFERIDAWHRERGRGRRSSRPSVIVESIPALVVPQSNRDGAGPREQDRRFKIVRLDRTAITEQLLPDLAQRYFGEDGADYAVTVRDANGVVYAANMSTEGAAADVEAPLFGILPYREIRELMRDQGDAAADTPRPGSPRERRGPRTPNDGDDRHGIWTVQVTHPAGSLANAVTRQRTRNLAISLAILAMLGVSVGLALRSARRAQELARQKMEFVAGISHELRTPLAVICSAGQNLADGVTGDAERTRRYGDVIRREGQRLAEMVEQVLDLARVQSGALDRSSELVDVHAAIDGAFADCRTLIDDHGVVIEQALPDELPLVRGESRALRQALRNLITNAIRHTNGRWVRVEATATGQRPGALVRIAVEDRGPGIEPAERERLFEAFYRGRAASRVHGSGLGLSLVRQIVNAHGGSVSIEGSSAGGSRFVVELPVATPDSKTAPAGERGAAETETPGRA